MEMNLVNYKDKIYCFVSENLRFRTCLFKGEDLKKWLDEHGIEKEHMSPKTWVKFIKETDHDTLYPQIPQGFVREYVSIDLPMPQMDFDIMQAADVSRKLGLSNARFKKLTDTHRFPSYEFYDEKKRYWRRETVEHYIEGYRKSNIIDVLRVITTEQYEQIADKVTSLEKIYLSNDDKSVYVLSEGGFKKIL